MAFRKVSRNNLFLARRFPFRRAVRLQIVKIVFKQLVKRGSRNICEFDLRFLACTACCTPFDDVLLAASGGLSHLINCTIAVSWQKSAAKCNGTLIYHVTLVIDDEITIAAMRQYNLGSFSHLSPLWEKGTQVTEET